MALQQASTALSINHWRSSCHLLAPRDIRTAVSACRAVARASVRPATLTQATSSTRVTVMNSARNAGSVSPKMWRRSGVKTASNLRSDP